MSDQKVNTGSVTRGWREGLERLQREFGLTHDQAMRVLLEPLTRIVAGGARSVP